MDVIRFNVFRCYPSLIKDLNGGDFSDAARTGWLLFAFSLVYFSPSWEISATDSADGPYWCFLLDLPAIIWSWRLRPSVFGYLWEEHWPELPEPVSPLRVLIADVSPPEKRAQNFGLIGAAFGAGLWSALPLADFWVNTALVFRFMAPPFSTIYWIGYTDILFYLNRCLKKKKENSNGSAPIPSGSLKHLKKYNVTFALIASLICIYFGSYAVQSNWVFYHGDFRMDL